MSTAALIEVDASSLTRVDGTPSARARTFHVLPSGPVPPNPQALLARPMMTHVIEDARAMADVVLVDVPPLGTVNDPITLANLVDGVVLVAHLGKHDARREPPHAAPARERRRAHARRRRHGRAPGEGYYGAYTSPTAGREPLAADST